MLKIEDYFVNFTFVDKDNNELVRIQDNTFYPIDDTTLKDIFGIKPFRLESIGLQDLRFLLADKFDIILCKSSPKRICLNENEYLKIID